MRYKTLSTGPLSSDSLKDCDYATAILSAIDIVRDCGYGDKHRPKLADLRLVAADDSDAIEKLAKKANLDPREWARYVMDKGTDWLDNHLPPYSYFGSSDGDGACFGIWVDTDSLTDDMRSGDIPGVDNIPKGYTGLAGEVSDHGNVSLYHYARGRYVRTIWAVT